MLKNFIDFSNQLHPTIKFTAEWSPNQVVFLDTIVKCEGNLLYTDLYTKETDTHSYLHFTSSHPKHVKDKGPYGQFLRLKRNCAKDEDFKAHSDKMFADYEKRGYPRKTILPQQTRAENLDRKSLFTPKMPKFKSEKVPLILTYNPMNPPIMGAILRRWEIAQTSEKGTNLFKDMPILAHRRCPNLKDKLIRAKLPDTGAKPRLDNSITEKTICDHRNCPIPGIFLRKNTFTSTTTARTYKKYHIGNCTTKNVIYMLTCIVCNQQYVGQTKRQFRIRIGEHLADIKHKRDSPVSLHFNREHHTVRSLRCEILEALKGDPEKDPSGLLRDRREQFWIHQLQSKHPNGMNKRD